MSIYLIPLRVVNENERVGKKIVRAKSERVGRNKNNHEGNCDGNSNGKAKNEPEEEKERNSFRARDETLFLCPHVLLLPRWAHCRATLSSCAMCFWLLVPV
jgi:hypothetical protein